jgi:4-hydroxybenzoate polyprenyltransferase
MQFILKSHIFLSICVVCFTAQTYWIYSDFNLPLTPLLINFVGTFCVYNLQKLYDATLESNEIEEKYKWYIQNRKLVLTLIVLSLLVSFNYVYHFLAENTSYFWCYFGAAIFTLLYYVKPLKLKRYGWYKPFHISIVFIFSCIIIPLYPKISTSDLPYITSQFLLIFCLSILYDYKDITPDLKINLQTFAVRLKLQHFKLLVSACSLSFIITSYVIERTFFYSSLASGVYLLGLLYFLNEKRNYIYYLFFIDGALMLQFCFTIFFS